MDFCPNCKYRFDISKSTNESIKDNRIQLNKFIDVLSKLEKKEDLTLYKANFIKEEMLKNIKYQKLKEEDKNKINQLFEDNLTSGAEFKCTNCNFSNQIVKTTLLFEMNIDDNFNKIKKIDDNELLCNDPLMPHTHDYTCKNPSCITHKDIKIKDAIFYKDKNSYKVNYICSVCFYNW